MVETTGIDFHVSVVFFHALLNRNFARIHLTKCRICIDLHYCAEIIKFEKIMGKFMGKNQKSKPPA